MKNTISKEKISNYLENKRNRLFEQGYYNQQHYNNTHDMYEHIFYGDQKNFDINQISKQLLAILPREQLQGEHETIPDYLSWGTRDQRSGEIQQRIKNRTMKEDEYKKITEQIDKHGSIIATSNRRERDFGHGHGSIILSLSTGKMYDVDGKGREELLKDYKGKQYYSSRSGSSGAGYIFAGKKSLIYLPIIRMDVKHPGTEGSTQEINGLEMAILTNRGAIDENYPTVIKNCAGVDMILLSQKDHLSPDGSGKLLGEVIKSKGDCLVDLPVKTFSTWYYDENLEEKELSFTYKTNMDPKTINFNEIGKLFMGIKREFDVESTGSFIDYTIGIRKYKDKYVRIGTFGLIKEVFDSYPIQQEEDKLYLDEIEVGSGNIIEKTKIEIPLSSDYTGNINGREISNNLAVRKNKRENFFSGYDFEEKCKEHGIDPQEICEGFDKYRGVKSKNVYNLIYEKTLADINPQYQNLDKVFMEYEEDIPGDIFEKYPRSYREEYMHDKLSDKAYNERSNYNNRSENTQKEIAKAFLRENPKEKLVLQDSYAVGNCEPGTKGFINAFGLDEQGVIANDLLKHKHLDRMMQESRFRAVLLKKVLANSSIS